MFRLGLLGFKSIYVEKMISSLQPHCDISLFTFSKKKETERPVKGIYEYRRLPLHRYLLGVIPAYIIIRKYNKTLDVIGVHYLNLHWELLLATHVIKCPTMCFVYGSDVNRRYGKLHFLLKKYVLTNFDKIFVELPNQKKMLINRYGLDPNKIISDITIWSVDSCFKKYDEDYRILLRKKWNLMGKYIIFSPRRCLEFYQHHLLIEAIGNLNEDVRTQIQIVVTQIEENPAIIDYLGKIEKMAQEYGVSLVSIHRCITPVEMAEIYNISHININIPKMDQFGGSIIEGCLCGSIPVLNDDISNYHEFMQSRINCIFVKPNPGDVATGICDIILHLEKYQKEMYLHNKSLFMEKQNYTKNSQDLFEKISELVETDPKK